jgi:chromosome segregation ATPase
LSVGSQGKTYANVCPVNLEAGFREGYELGRLHHEKKREISSRESRIRSLENSIREDEKLLAAGTDDRRAVERRIDDNRRTIRDLDRDIGRMESDLRRIEDDMEDFRYRAAPLSQG